MKTASEDLKSLYISNLTTIKELRKQVEQLESEKNSQNISNLNTIRELNNRLELLESEKNSQNISNLNIIKELGSRVEQLESEKNDQFLQLATGIITVMDTFEKLMKAVSKKALNKTAKGKKVFDRYKKVRNSLEELLLQFEISKITFPDNQLIAGLYKVVGTEADADKTDDTILSIVKSGYTRGTELIREAEVIVVKNHQYDQSEISDPGLNHSL
jgi:molecular chaperone GrpE (heat shock protein)